VRHLAVDVQDLAELAGERLERVRLPSGAESTV